MMRRLSFRQTEDSAPRRQVPDLPVASRGVLSASGHIADLQRTVGNRAVARLLGPRRTAHGSTSALAVQRYLYDVLAVQEPVPGAEDTSQERLPSARLTYSDDYKARGAPNLRLRHREQIHLPQRRQIFVDNPSYSGRMRGYLKDTIWESKRVVGAANLVLDELRARKTGGAFMVGVMETLDGNLRIANSGSRSGHVEEIASDLDRVSRAAKAASRPRAEDDPMGADERQAIASPKNVGSPVEFVNKVDTTPFERYLSRDAHVLSGHLNCAAPKLLLSAVGAGGALDMSHLTEVWWDPDGKSPVLINGVRYHHLQRVPSCERCEQNLRVLVNWELRAALEREFHRTTSTRQLNHVEPEDLSESNADRGAFAIQKPKRELLDRMMTNATTNVAKAHDLVTDPAVLAIVEQVQEQLASAARRHHDAVFNGHVTVEEFRAGLRELRQECTRILKAGAERLKPSRAQPTTQRAMNLLLESVGSLPRL